ncbi:MAG TPA: response regulator [Spirochaetales bacterium]|nr:response regulator [Spirochaetales bacterium]
MNKSTSEPSAILLVEDNPDDEELTIAALKNSGITNRVVVARDGREALDFLFRQGIFALRDITTEPRLVLLDLKLPTISGMEVLMALRAHNETRFLPVVVLTTSNQEEDILGSYKLGANSFIRKPVGFAKFSEAIKQLGRYWLLLNELPAQTSSACPA